MEIEPVLIPMRGLQASPLSSNLWTHEDGNTDNRRGDYENRKELFIINMNMAVSSKSKAEKYAD
jgi:hypothetical protein